MCFLYVRALHVVSDIIYQQIINHKLLCIVLKNVFSSEVDNNMFIVQVVPFIDNFIVGKSFMTLA